MDAYDFDVDTPDTLNTEEATRLLGAPVTATEEE